MCGAGQGALSDSLGSARCGTSRCRRADTAQFGAPMFMIAAQNLHAARWGQTGCCGRGDMALMAGSGMARPGPVYASQAGD